MASPTAPFSSPFPAPSKSSSSTVAGKPTNITSISFADKVFLTISQTRNLAHWVHVPLAAASTDPFNPGPFPSHDASNALLPLSQLTATTVLGGTKRDDEVVGQTLATTIASALLLKRPHEERMLILGLGLADPAQIGRAEFDELVGAVLDLV